MPSKFPLVTLFLLVTSTLAALASNLGSNLESIQTLFYSFYIQPDFVELKQGQLWRVITPIFIHFGLLHLVMNAVMLWFIGRLLEPLHGYLMYLMVVMLIAIISNTAQYLVSGPLFGGLSGVVYGLLGFVWGLGKFSPTYPIRLNPKFTTFIIGWFVLCWSGLLSLIGIHIANTAHTAGLVSGVAFAYLLVQWYQRRLK